MKQRLVLGIFLLSPLTHACALSDPQCIKLDDPIEYCDPVEYPLGCPTILPPALEPEDLDEHEQQLEDEQREIFNRYTDMHR